MNKLFLLLLIPILAFGQATTGYHRVNQLISRGTSGVTAQIVPNGSIYVTNTVTGATATIYSDPGLSIQITSGLVTSDKNGNYDYYIPLSYCVNEAVSSPGQGSYTTKNICINSAGGIISAGTAGQIPYYAANGTTVSPTSSLPNGITAATQTTGDNTTKVATDAFVLANAPTVNFAAPPVLGSATPNVVNGTNGNFSGTVAAGTSMSAPVTNGVQTVPAISGDATTAINSALSSAGPGGTVQLTPGSVYTTLGTINVTQQGLTLNFNGACIKPTGTGDSLLVNVTTGMIANVVLNSPCFIAGGASTGASIHDTSSVFGTKVNNPSWKQLSGNSPSNGYYWHYLIQVNGDEQFTIDGAQVNGTFLECDVTFCGDVLYNTPGLGTGSAAVVYLNNSSFNLENDGNGVDWGGYGNDLHLSSVVIENTSQFMIRSTPTGAGTGDVICDKCHLEDTGSSTNPALNGIHAVALVIMNGGTFHNHGGRLEGADMTFHATGTTGSTAWSYFFIAKSATYGDTAPIPWGHVSNGTADWVGSSVALTFPCFTPTGSDTITYSILRTTGTTPYPNDNVSDVVAMGQTCTGTYWTYTDTVLTSALTTYTFTVNRYSFFPNKVQYFWGSIFLGGAAANDNTQEGSYTGDCQFGNNVITARNYSLVNFPQVWCDSPSYTYNPNGSPVNVVQAVHYTPYYQSAFMLQNKFGVYTGGGQKGVLNLGYSNAPMDILTLSDSSPYKTLSTSDNRPGHDAADSALGSDSSTGDLALRSGSSIDLYVNNYFDGSNWQEKLTGNTKILKSSYVNWTGLLGLPAGTAKYGLQIDTNGAISPTGTNSIPTAQDLTTTYLCIGNSGTWRPYTCTTSPNFTQTSWDLFLFVPDVTNTNAGGLSPELNINGGGNVYIYQQTAAGPATQVPAGTLQAGVPYWIAHSPAFQYLLVGPAVQPITLTATGTSGAATYSNGALNIPQYAGGSASTVPGDLICAHMGDTTIDNLSITGGSCAGGSCTINVNTGNQRIYQVPGQLFGIVGSSTTGLNGGPYTLTSSTGLLMTFPQTASSGTVSSGGDVFLWCENQAADATTATAFSNNTIPVPANTMVAGTPLNHRAQLSFVSSSTPPGLTPTQVFIGSTPVLATAGPSAIDGSMAFRMGEIGFDLVPLTVGSSGLITASWLGIPSLPMSYQSTAYWYNINTPNPTMINTTNSNVVSLSTAYTATGLGSITASSGCTVTGSIGQTVLLTSFNNGNTTATATGTLIAANTISGATWVVTNTGQAATAAATSATCGNGTATASGTATLTTTLGGAQGNAVMLVSLQ